MENFQEMVQSIVGKTKVVQQAQMTLQATQNEMFIPLPEITVLASNVNVTQTVTINADGPYKIKAMTGDIEPDASGINTISIKITDMGTGRPLTDGAYVPANLFLTPGIRTNTLFNPWRFNHILKPNSSLQFDFLNSDGTNRVCNIVLFGIKLRGNYQW